jgi:uncharacterized protein (TIGR02246 family)
MEARDAMQAQFDCLQLVEKVRRAADEDPNAFADGFTLDGVWKRPGADPMVGQNAIRTMMSSRPGGRVTRHIGGGADVELLSADRAVVHSRITLYTATHSESLPARLTGPEKVLEYRDDLIRTAEGWRIAVRQTTVAFAAG